MMFLVSPCLRNIIVSSEPPYPATVVLNSLQITAPNISHLFLYSMSFDDRSISVLCLLSQLQQINVSHKVGNGERATLDLSFFLRLSCKETLRKIYLHGLHIIWSVASPDSGIVEFSLLEYIDVEYCTSLGPVAELLRYAMVPRLKELRIGVRPSPSRLLKAVETQYWHQFFDLIPKATTNYFKILRLEPDSNDDATKDFRESWEHVGLTVSALPIFDNLSLETFEIEAPLLCSLSRNDLQKIINSWPGLSNLQLTSCQAAKLDFTALIDIAVGLPQLERLAIPLDIRGDLGLEGIPLLAHNLRSIVVEILVTLKDRHMLVQCIDKVFPYLVGGYLHNSDRDEWQDLGPLLDMLQTARRDELRRAALGITGVKV